jgi:hypothetical protein
MARIQDPTKLERNHEIWVAYARGTAVVDIAATYGLSRSQVYEILNQVKVSIPDEDREQLVKMRRAFLDEMREAAAEVMRQDPAPAFAPNGKAHVDPKTGEPVYDYGTRLAAIDRGIKLDERLAKLTGTDAPTASVQAHVPLVPPGEVQRVMLEQAAKAQQSIARRELREELRAEIMQEMTHAATRN